MRVNNKMSSMSLLQQILLSSAQAANEGDFLLVQKIAEAFPKSFLTVSLADLLTETASLRIVITSILIEGSTRCRLVIAFLSNLTRLYLENPDPATLHFFQALMENLPTKDSLVNDRLKEAFKSIYLDVAIEIGRSFGSFLDFHSKVIEEQNSKSASKAQDEIMKHTSDANPDTIQIKHSLLPKLNIELVTGNINLPIASRSSRRQNISSFSPRNSPQSNQFGKNRLKVFASNLGQTALCRDLVYLLYKHREGYANQLLFNAQKNQTTVNNDKKERNSSRKKIVNSLIGNDSRLKIESNLGNSEQLADSKTFDLISNSQIFLKEIVYRSNKLKKTSEILRTSAFDIQPEKKDRLAKYGIINSAMKNCLSNKALSFKDRASARIKLKIFDAEKKDCHQKNKLLRIQQTGFGQKRWHELMKQKNESITDPLQSGVQAVSLARFLSASDLKQEIEEIQEDDSAQLKSNLLNKSTLFPFSYNRKAAQKYSNFENSKVYSNNEDSRRILKTTNKMLIDCENQLKLDESGAMDEKITFQIRMAALYFRVFKSSSDGFVNLLFRHLFIKEISERLVFELLSVLYNEDGFKKRLKSFVHRKPLTPQTLKRILTIFDYTQTHTSNDIVEVFLEEFVYLKDVLITQNENVLLISKLLKIVKSMLKKSPEHRFLMAKLFPIESAFVRALENFLSKVRSLKFEKQNIEFIESVITFYKSFFKQLPQLPCNLAKKLASRLFSVKFDADIDADRYLFGEYLLFLMSATNEKAKKIKNLIYFFGQCFKYCSSFVVQSYYIRLAYLGFLKGYCLKNPSECVFLELNFYIDLLILLASNKEDENITGIFNQLNFILFFCKELDLECELPFMLSKATPKNTKPIKTEKEEFQKMLMPKLNLKSTEFQGNSALFQKPFGYKRYTGLGGTTSLNEETLILSNNHSSESKNSKKDFDDSIGIVLSGNQKDDEKLRPTILNLPFLPKEIQQQKTNPYSKTRDQKPLLTVDNMQMLTSFQQKAADDEVENSENHKILYQNLREKRTIYRNSEIHLKVLKLISILLINKSLTSLNEDSTGQYPIQNGKQNFLFLLQQHLSIDSNKSIALQLLIHLQDESAKAERNSILRAMPKGDALDQKMRKLFESQASKIVGQPKNVEESDCIDPANSRNFCDVMEFQKSQQKFDVMLNQAIMCLIKCLTPTEEPEISIKHKIGFGAYSVVKRAEIFKCDSFAVKCVSADRTIYDRNSIFYLFNELRILENFESRLPNTKHRPEFARLIDFWHTREGQIFLLFPHYHKKTETIGNLKSTLKVMYDIILNVKELHSQGIVHYDIKCDNVMNGENRHLLVDFGESLQSEQSFRLRGTELIRPPEMINSKLENFDNDNINRALNYKDLIDLYNRQSKFHDGMACDIWALGCLLYELYSGEMLFYEKDWGAFYKRITTESQSVLTHENITKLGADPILVGLLNYLLTRSPQQRPEIGSVFKKFKSACVLLNVEIDSDNKRAIDALENITEKGVNLDLLNSEVFSQAACISWQTGVPIDHYWANARIVVCFNGDSLIGKLGCQVLDLDLEFQEIKFLAFGSKLDSKRGLMELIISTFWAVYEIFKLKTNPATVIQMRSTKSIMPNVLLPLIIGYERARLDLTVFIEIQAKSLYLVKYASSLIDLLSDVWAVLRKDSRVGLNAVKCNCGFILATTNIQKENLRISADPESEIPINSSFNEQYKNFLVQNFGVYPPDLQSIEIPLNELKFVVQNSEKNVNVDENQNLAINANFGKDKQLYYCKKCSQVFGLKLIEKGIFRTNKFLFQKV